MNNNQKAIKDSAQSIFFGACALFQRGDGLSEEGPGNFEGRVLDQ